MNKRAKSYLRIRDPNTGRQLLLHRLLAARMLGRPLSPGEIVHHRDGNCRNNTQSNLLVLPSQQLHAHIEHLLRCEKRGQQVLFSDLLLTVRQERPGTLFEYLLPLPSTAAQPG